MRCSTHFTFGYHKACLFQMPECSCFGVSVHAKMTQKCGRQGDSAAALQVAAMMNSEVDR